MGSGSSTYGEPLIVEPQTKESTINSTQPSHDRPLIMIKTEDSEKNLPLNENRIEQWVSHVLSYSSQYDANSWNANQVVGNPSVYPRYGDIRGAWAQGHINANQYIEVGFKTPVYIEKIEIYETYHAGGVKKILAMNPNNQYQVVWQTNTVKNIDQARIFSPEFQALTFPCGRLHIEVDCSVSKSWVEIDAVKITGTKTSGVTSTNNTAFNRNDTIEQWVSAVTNYSSQYDNKSWPATCVIGPPKVYPSYGDIPGAWAPKVKDGNQYLMLEFPEKLYITGIQIYETYHAGGVKCIKAKQPNGNLFTVWTNSRVTDIKSSQILSPSFQQLTFPCNELRLEVDCSACQSWVEIDAVKIIGTKTPGDISTSKVQPTLTKNYIPAGPPVYPPATRNDVLRPREPLTGTLTNPARTDSNKIELFVSRVINFSSQYDSFGWAADSVIGEPKVFPRYGDINGAWASEDLDDKQFIEVEFAEKIFIDKIDIYETYNTCGVKRILAKRPNFEWYTVWETPRVQCQEVSRIFSPSFKKLNFPCNTLRIEIDCTVSGSWVEIDAIKLRGTKFKFDIAPPQTDIGIDLRKMVNNPMFSDIKFNVNRTIYYAHKMILFARSTYFSSQFNQAVKKQSGGGVHGSQTQVIPSAPPMDTKPEATALYLPSYDSVVNPQPIMPIGPVPDPAFYNQKSQDQPVIEINDVTPTAFLMVLFYLYSNDLPASCLPQALPGVWRAAHKFGIEDLKNLTLLKLNQSLHVNNVIEIYQEVISNQPIDHIKGLCEQFMQNNMAEVVRHKSFIGLPKHLLTELTQMMVLPK